jgi:lipopolysaccharide/colanic/teichoic acid biosynthesis glycosyltransferase
LKGKNKYVDSEESSEDDEEFVDELPLNVIKIKKRYKLGIYKIKPGITGLAQINGRDKISVHKKIYFD